MSRSSNQRQQQQLLAQQQQQMADNDAAAAAAEMFDMFCLATTMRQVLGLHRNICDAIGLRPAPLNEFYPKLKAKIRSWKAQALWKKFDARASHRAYSKGNACTGTRVLVIGAGPCGLRTAIEAQLLGAKVVVVEKRDRISRNNVLHLWPFVITDLRNLGAKKFYGKFCAGSIDHISIRQIQCILLKVALLLGVEVHEGVSFEGTIEPSEGCGWRAAISPEDHAVSHYEFDVLIGADGKRNTLEAFKRKEFRGKLAIAITANFINKKTEAEAKAEEISGVAFIFNQAFFKELYHTTGIDLENIVYYKDETHYFVMTAKKHSLIDKGVIMQDFADPAELLAPQNVNTDKLLDYAREAAEFSTKYQMPNLEFAVNHYGKPDVAMFDFTSMFAAESSSRVIVRKNYRLLQCLVGDSLLEPFWPTGSGCARGFLSSMDAAYAIKLWNNPRNSILGVLAQRESIYRLLAQTTPENLQRDIGSYTVDPATRYPNLNRTSVNMYQVKHLIDTDDKAILEQTYMDTNALQASQADTPVRRKRRTGDTLPLSAVLLRWIKAQLHSYEFVQNLNEVSDCFTNGKVLCALINRYRPDLVDFNSIKELPAADCNDLAFKILDKELKISKVMSGKDSIDLDKIDSKIWLNYLEQVCEVFRGEIPHVKHPKLDVSELREKNRNNVPDFSRLLQMTSSRKAKSPMQDVADLPHATQRRSVLDEEKVKRQRKHEPGQGQLDTPRRAKKRRSAEKTTNIEERQQRLKEIEENRQDRQSKRRMQRFQQTQNFYKSLHMLQVNTLLRESDESSPFEDYSIYMYRQQAPIFNDRVKELERKLLYPDRERGISSAMPRGTDEQFSDRIKSMEQQITSRNAYGTEKKPKDLMRAIGKIDSNDWNVREIEKKIEQSKKTEIGLKGREKVPKWSKEQFVARQSKMSKPTRQDSSEEKFKEIDQTLKNLDKQLKEGSVLEVGERGKNKVASIAGQFVKKDDTSEEKLPPTQPIAKSNSKVALAFKKQAASEKCHFCKQTVYLMEKISTEGLILHRSCLKCHHCHTNLRPGGYAFDRDDPEGRFYCTQHFRLPAKAIRPMVRKPGQRKSTAHGSHAPSHLDPKTPEKPRGITESVVQLDLLDRGQTPERIEFENTDAMSDGEPSEEHIIDENEWSGRNFLQPSADSESDLSSSSDESDDDSESDIFEEANGSPIAQQTLQLATDWIGKQHYSNVNSDDSDDDFYDSSEGLADDGKDDTEGEEIKKAREMRREEVRLLPLPTNLPTDTETEVQSDSESSSADDVELNSATEISTDSEFDHDEIIREAPKIFIDDTHLRKPTKVQIKQTVIAPTTGQPKYHINNRMTHQQLTQQQLKREPQFKPLVQVDPSLLSSNRMPLQNPRPGDYLLNKTASTEGIASKKSLELKKRYLLGEQGNGNKIQKSGSTSILDSKIRSFHSNISECQKLLNAGSMKPFLDRTKVTENQTAVDKKIEITIKKTAAIDEKENVFVNSKNELNKGMEYSETVNTTLVESLNKNKPSPIIETIDLISPEKSVPIIDLTEVEIPSKMLESNLEFIKNLQFNGEDGSSKENSLVPDNKIIDLTLDSPVKSDKTVIEEVIEKPDVSKDVKEAIPDIITHIEEVNLEMITLLDHEAEKKDSPEKSEYDIQETSIQVPNIPWTIKKCIEESDSLSSSSSSSSVEDIQHFILDSTTSPDTQTGQIVPRLEVHDSSGTLMQIDSLMIIDGKYIGDPEDLKNMEIPPGMIIPEIPTQSPSPEEPITEKRKDDSPPPSSSPPQKPELKFDTKNENKIDTLKNIPLILEKSEDHTRGGVVKPDSLNIQVDDKRADSDNDKTPTAEGITRGSDSDAEITNQGGLTETELSDWTADDAISENFIDLEFVLNSNKGTIKRNKKSKKKAPLQSSLSITQEPDPEPEPEPEPCGILKNLDIEEIEFMDTGSEGSCAEAYSATNTALLRNRGYAEYTGSPRNYRHNRAPPPTEHELKTPVNECPTLPSTVSLLSQKSQSPSITTTTTTPPKPQNSPPSQTQHTNNTQSLSQSLTDSTNDIDEDSLCMLTNSNGATANNTATITTTTEESEALTVVTSPMDSSSPKTQENFQLTPSSSDPNGKTTSPSSHTTATPVTSSSSKGPTRKSSHEDLLTHSNSKRKESEEMSYEEYVRKLQQKITQISNARDSIDVRKQNRRKSSKGEGSEANSVIEGGSAKGLSVFEGGFSASVQQQPKVVLSTINVTANPAQDVHKVPVIPTLSSKLEELTKERTKQKDLIHDLVMDKLQCKKQLNAEKRLNRSRNRSIFGNNLACSSLSPTPKMTSTNTSPYHVTSSSGGDHSGSSCKENHPLSAQKINKSSPKDTKDVVQMFSEAPPRSAKQRPFSENFDPDSIDDQMCKLSKTQSFTYSSRGGNFPFKTESNGSRLNTVYASPLTVTRPSRKDEPIGTASNADKLRTEARARARLKSNQDLGLSPEEKLQLLRKRYHLDLQEASAEAAQMKSEELRARDRKMISSKSVNDIATAQLLTLQPDENSNTTTVRSDLVADFTSDPNLSQMNPMSMTNKVNRRQKDPERRKSIIQTFSSFFQKGNKKDKDIVGPISGTEKSGTSQSSAATVNSNNNGGGGDGMFSRFRISPKSKEKSKSCFDVRNIGFGDNGSSPTTPVATTPQHQYRHHHDQRSNSQDCIAKQKYQKISSYASSPQLFKNTDEQIPPPIPPLPLNYQRSDDESYATESREQKKQRAITKATRQAELKRLRIAQEIQREQEEIEVQLKELEARGVLIEKALRGEGQTIDNLEASNMGANDEKLLKELLEIWRNITQLKKRDEELGIRQQELQLEHRHAQLKEELNIRLSGSKLEKSSADVAAEGAILNEMLEIVAKRAALRPTSSGSSPVATTGTGAIGGDDVVNDGITFSGRRSSQIDESDI
ncbi:F-actin-monooxygenase Mical isoform X6 [Episyrphus balteatus]|uniref:F-actin-monooxygenase Mical isoform X6 n=1 Tax=Episyrphus balteatus TaxID=286459 RepID=UPI002484E514|nr:F-actin-monooxygenase Mical isoform X6 [Episyrphus balteatus]